MPCESRPASGGSERRQFDDVEDVLDDEAGRCSCRGYIASWSRRARVLVPSSTQLSFSRFLSVYTVRVFLPLCLSAFPFELPPPSSFPPFSPPCWRGDLRARARDSTCANSRVRARLYKYGRDSTRRISNELAVKHHEWKNLGLKEELKAFSLDDAASGWPRGTGQLQSDHSTLVRSLLLSFVRSWNHRSERSLLLAFFRILSPEVVRVRLLISSNTLQRADGRLKLVVA